jgi:glucose-1-phosphate thymidylyltransferase
MNAKGVILAGGLGTRLYPITKIISKHLIPVYNKPMIFYSLSVLLYSGIKNILIIVDQEQYKSFEKIISPIKSKHNLNIKYKIQKNPKGGIAEALLLSSDFSIKSNKTCLILGDNFFYGRDMPKILKNTLKVKDNNAHIFLCPVKKPNNYGIAYLYKKNQIKKIIEKPNDNKSNLAVTGLYIYPKNVETYIKKIKRSKRGELEITSLNKLFLKDKKLNHTYLGRGITWFDMGTFENIAECSKFIELIESKQGFKIANL